MQPKPGNMGLVASGHLDPPAARVFQHRPHCRHGLGQDEGKPSERVHALGHLG